MCTKASRNCKLKLQIENCKLHSICNLQLQFAIVPAFHRDEDGTISILSVFAVLGLTMLLGMVMNVGRQVDGKIRMQNAADAAAYSGGVTLARGMNTLAFTNHLLCDVFANTALLREARDRNSESYVPSDSGGVGEGGAGVRPLRLPQVRRPRPGHHPRSPVGAEPGHGVRRFGPRRSATPCCR